MASYPKIVHKFRVNVPKLDMLEDNDTSINNTCVYITDIMSCSIVINDNEDFCSAHKDKGYDYETMLKRKIKSVNVKLDTHNQMLEKVDCTYSKKFLCNAMFRFVTHNTMCLSNNEINDKLSTYFLKIGYPDTYSRLCIMANELHERKSSNKYNVLTMTTDDKITLHV